MVGVHEQFNPQFQVPHYFFVYKDSNVCSIAKYDICRFASNQVGYW
jgi:hypothetical protein